MPSYQFKNQENKVYFDPKLVGDFRLEVVRCQFGLVKNGPNAGDDKMELTIRADGSEIEMLETFTFSEKSAWKIDTFVKSTNLLINGNPPALNENIEFTEPMVVGLRGWGTVGVQEYEAKDKSKKLKNKVKTWITNKEKLAKKVVQAEPENEDPDWKN